jgi:hypothetical protein
MLTNISSSLRGLEACEGLRRSASNFADSCPAFAFLLFTPLCEFYDDKVRLDNQLVFSAQ